MIAAAWIQDITIANHFDLQQGVQLVVCVVLG